MNPGTPIASILFIGIILLTITSVSPAQINSTIPTPPRGKVYSEGGPIKSSVLQPSGAAMTGYFTANIQIHPDIGNAEDDFGPVVAIYGDTIYVVWNSDETLKSIYFTKSTDGGQTFSPAAKINDDVIYPPGFSVFQRDIDVDAEGNIYVVWHDYRAWTSDADFSSPIEVYLDKSMDGGVTWGTDRQITSGSGSFPWHFQPYIAVGRKNSLVYVVFSDYDGWQHGDFGDVSLVVSTDTAQTFNPKIQVDDTPDSLNAIQLFSSIDVDQSRGEVYVSFHDNRNGDLDIYLAKSVDTGVSFLPNVRVNTVLNNNQEEPDVAINPKNGDVLVAWKDWRADPMPDSADYLNDIYVARSTDKGQTFNPGVKVTDEFMNAAVNFNFPPDITVDTAGKVCIVWHDTRRGFSNVFYDQSLDGGNSFGYDVIVNNNLDTLSHALPRITIDSSGDSYIVWIDRRNPSTTGNKWDIFLAGSFLESCTPHLEIGGLITNGTYQAGILLESDATLTGPGNILFRSGHDMNIRPSFTVKTGTQFEIVIEPCQ